MGCAIAYGITHKKVYKNSQIIFVENKLKRANFLKRKYKVFNSVISALKVNQRKYNAIILAVKPNNIKEVILKIKNHIDKNTLIVSIAAGVRMKTLSSKLNKNQPLARVMPNTPCQIGEGVSAITFNQYVTKSQKKLVKKIFNSIGKTIILEETKFDLVTAISGSGPAYFCYFIESLIKAAKYHKISDKIASELVLQTASGTTNLLNLRKVTPVTLRKSVTSPNGTTEAALKVFKKQNIDKTILKAINAAKIRSIELGKS